MEQDLKKDIFLLIDGSAIVHRAYHAMPFFAKKDGTPTGAVYGFFSMLLKVMHQLEPTKIAVAFDRPKPTFRKQLYVGYQAQRPKMESDLSSQYKKIIEILKAARIPTYAVDGYEADDVIGTISDKANTLGEETYIVTGDRDMLQLVDSDTKVFMPIKGISEVSIMDAEKVREKYGINPPQIVELKALMGDASDNYPGVPGVGPKTAANLINEYQTIDNIYKNIDEIASKNAKLAQKLIDGHDDCRISHQLAKIVTDVPFVFDFKDSEVQNIQTEDFKKALEKEEFHTLPKRVDEIFQKDGTFNHDGKGQMKLL
jgi:DNA polymerase-1